MKRLKFILFPFFVAALAIHLTGIRCTAGNEEIPITTSSKEALELFKQGRELWDNVRLQESGKYFEKAIAEDSTFALVYLYLALSAYSADRFYEYLNQAESLTDQISDGEKILIMATKTDFVDNDPVTAKALYQKLVALYPNDKRSHNWYSFYCFRRRDYKTAVVEEQKAIEIDPGFASPYNNLGYCQAQLGNFDAAEAAMKKYAELIPEQPNPHDSYGEILMRQGKFGQSVDEYKTALSIDSTFYMSYVGLASSQLYEGQAETARETMTQYLNGAPDDGYRRDALFSLARLYVYEGDTQNALEMFKKRRAIAEKHQSPLEIAEDAYWTAEILLESGKIDEAQAKYLENVKLIEQSEVASSRQKDEAKQGLLYSEARIALKNNDLSTARAKAKAYAGMAEADKDSSEIRASHELTGMIALHEKRYDDAVNELKQVNLKNPRNLCRMAAAYSGQGNADKAKECWSKAANFNNMSMDFAFIRNRAKAKLDEMD